MIFRYMLECVPLAAYGMLKLDKYFFHRTDDKNEINNKSKKYKEDAYD